MKRIIVEYWTAGRWICLLNNPVQPEVEFHQIRVELAKELETSNRRLNNAKLDNFGVALFQII